MDNHSPYHTLQLVLTGSETPISFEQIRLCAKAALACGVSSIELCGSDPLDREDIPVLCMMLSSLPGFRHMSLTTDGILLPRWAKALRGAGVMDVTVKLDTFNPAIYRTLTAGGDLTAVLAGIRSLMEVGFPPATIEARLIRSVNDAELPSLARLTKMTGVSLRLMEMTANEAAAFFKEAHMTCEEALEHLPNLAAEGQNPLVCRFEGAAGTITLVPSCTRGDGCILLDADGTLRAGESILCVRDADEDAMLAAVQALMR